MKTLRRVGFQPPCLVCENAHLLYFTFQFSLRLGDTLNLAWREQTFPWTVTEIPGCCWPARTLGPRSPIHAVRAGPSLKPSCWLPAVAGPHLGCRRRTPQPPSTPASTPVPVPKCYCNNHHKQHECLTLLFWTSEAERGLKRS